MKMKLKQRKYIFHVIVNAISIVQHVIQIKNRIMKHVNVNVKIIMLYKKDYSWNPSTCVCENRMYLKIIADTSAIECAEICYEYCINKNDKYYSNKCNKRLS